MMKQKPYDRKPGKQIFKPKNELTLSVGTRTH